MPVLIQESGAKKGQAIRLEPDRLYTIGRDPKADIFLDDELASRVHAKLRGKDGRFFLKDHHSSNGTFVNDEALAPMKELASGDKVAIGSTLLTFLSDTEAGGGAGRTLGGYRLLQRMGRGGMGTVYRALQLSLNREVALKMLSPELSRDDSFVERFLKEARSAGQLNHPNIVQVYDVHRIEDVTFYSMEFMPGGTVEDLVLKKGRLEEDEALRLMLEAARGLQYAELKKIVHRDIKPDNLMLTEIGVVKVADLGLAMAAHEGESEGVILGTPHFISPEQARGQTLDSRSDMYSLGASFYRMLTGKTMFHGKQAQEIIRKQVKEEPPSLKDEAGDLSDQVEAIYQKLVRKDPADRYQTCDELVTDLEAAVSAKEHGRGMLFAVVALVVIVIGGGLFILFGNGNNPGEPVGPKIVVDDSKSEELEQRMAEQQAMLAKQRRENAAMKERLGLDQRADELSREELMAALRQLAADHPDTASGSAATTRADEIAAQLDAERAAREQRDRQVEAHIAAVTTSVEAALAEQRFVDAWHALVGGDPDSAGLNSDERVQAAITNLDRQIADRFAERTGAVLNAAREALAGNEFENALRQLAASDGLVAGRERLPQGEGGARSRLEGIANTVSALRGELNTARAAHRAGLLAEDLRRLRSEFDWDAFFEAQRDYRFQDAVTALQALKGQLTTAEYRDYLERHLEDLTAAAQQVERFREAVTANRIARPTVTHPERKIQAEIAGLSSRGDGLQLRVTRGSGASSSQVPFRAFDEVDTFLDLLVDRTECTPADHLELARGAVLIGMTRWSEAVDAIRAELEAYDTEKGWDKEQRQRMAALEIGPVRTQRLDQLLADVTTADPGLADQVSALLARVDREEQARVLFLEALEPFRSEQPSIHFATAVERLERLTREFHDTDFFLVAYEIFDDGQASLPLIE